MWILWTWLALILPTTYACFLYGYPGTVKDGDYHKEAVKNLQKSKRVSYNSDDVEKERIRVCARETAGVSFFCGCIWPLFLLCTAGYYTYKAVTWPFTRMADKDIKAVDDRAAMKKAEELSAQYAEAQRKKWVEEFGGKDHD